ncbi:ArgS-related anticodon-binding protein NrtL [Streptomyces boninensis]|uniref:ArgS-related anticodon-binding protein NrtL n=1 Tax=Streptomyces boninensis TaxID=2039455 RepID=UPI003B220803
MTPAELSRTVRCALRAATAEGELTLSGDLPERIVVTPPRPGGTGDYATSIALQLATAANLPPRELAERLRPRLERADGITKVEITGPGFLNFTLAANRHEETIAAALREGGSYAESSALAGETYTLHPTPGDVRAELTAQSLSRLLRAAGAEVMPLPPGEGVPQGGTGWPGTFRNPPHPAGTAIDVRVHPTPLSRAQAEEARSWPEDPLRWALLRPAAGDRPRLDETLLTSHESSPLFRIQYAHTRTRATARNAADLAIRHTLQGDIPSTEGAALITAIADLPTVVETAAIHRSPDRLARHLEQLATACLAFQADHPPLPRGDEEVTEKHHARLRLTAAAGTALKQGLTLLGITAPERI